jgi:nitronate monooxygenase
MSLKSLLGVELPIIQAPMAGVQGSALTVAVCNAGGLGSLPGALLNADLLRDELRAITAQTTKPYNVNFFCHAPPKRDAAREAAWIAKLAPYYEEFGLDQSQASGGPSRAPFSDEAADVLEPFRPPIVSFHFGLPSPELVARVRNWGAKVLCSATTVDEARWLEARGVDVIIAQGFEAGGHRGMFLTDDLTTQVGTLALVRQVVVAVKTPVVAAGGIVDAQGVRAALALGAVAAQIGTAYLLCPECGTSTVHRNALKNAAARHTALTNIFTGRPARAIFNRFMREMSPIQTIAPAFPLATAAVTPLRAHSEGLGSGDFSPLWSGQNAAGAREIPAAELTRELAAGLN